MLYSGNFFMRGVSRVVDAIVNNLFFDLEGVHHFLVQCFLVVFVLAGLYDFIDYGNLQLFVPFQLALYCRVYAFQTPPENGVQFVLDAVLRPALEYEYLPGRLREIQAQRLPMLLWRRTSSASSSQFQSFLLMELSKWLWYLYRHCLPFLPDIPNWVFMAFAIYDHLFIFLYSCRLFSTLSSLLNPQVLLQSTPYALPSIITNNKITTEYLKNPSETSMAKGLQRETGDCDFLFWSNKQMMNVVNVSLLFKYLPKQTIGCYINNELVLELMADSKVSCFHPKSRFVLCLPINSVEHLQLLIQLHSAFLCYNIFLFLLCPPFVLLLRHFLSTRHRRVVIVKLHLKLSNAVFEGVAYLLKRVVGEDIV